MFPLIEFSNDLYCHTFNVPISLIGHIQHLNHSGTLMHLCSRLYSHKEDKMAILGQRILESCCIVLNLQTAWSGSERCVVSTESNWPTESKEGCLLCRGSDSCSTLVLGFRARCVYSLMTTETCSLQMSCETQHHS